MLIAQSQKYSSVWKTMLQRLHTSQITIIVIVCIIVFLCMKQFSLYDIIYYGEVHLWLLTHLVNFLYVLLRK